MSRQRRPERLLLAPVAGRSVLAGVAGGAILRKIGALVRVSVRG